MTEPASPAPLPRPIGDSIRLALDQTAASVPAGKHAAVTVNASAQNGQFQGIEASFAVATPGGWELAVWGAVQPGVGNAIGARVQGTW